MILIRQIANFKSMPNAIILYGYTRVCLLNSVLKWHGMHCHNRLLKRSTKLLEKKIHFSASNNPIWEFNVKSCWKIGKRRFLGFFRINIILRVLFKTKHLSGTGWWLWMFTMRGGLLQTPHQWSQTSGSMIGHWQMSTALSPCAAVILNDRFLHTWSTKRTISLHGVILTSSCHRLNFHKFCDFKCCWNDRLGKTEVQDLWCVSVSNT